MCMSDSSRDNGSNGSLKSLKGRLQSRQGFDTAGLKKSFNHLSGVTKNMGSTLQHMFSKSDSSVYSEGVRELDKYGYEKYNIEDESEIFISKVPDRAMFNDGEPLMVRATGGNFVGSVDTKPSEVFDDVIESPKESTGRFSNVVRGTMKETEYHATVGVNNDGVITPVVDNSFLSKMSKGAAPKQVEVPEHENVFIELQDEEASAAPEDVPEEIPAAPATPMEQASAEPAEAEVPEVVEEPSYDNSFLSKMSKAPAVERDSSRHIEFIIDPEEETIEEAADDVQEADSDEDYSWIFEDDDEVDAVPEDAPVIGSIEANAADVSEEEVSGFCEFDDSLEVGSEDYYDFSADDGLVEQADVSEGEVAEVEDVPAVTGFVEAVEAADAEAPVEEAVSEDAPVEMEIAADESIEESFEATEAEDVPAVTGFVEAVEAVSDDIPAVTGFVEAEEASVEPIDTGFVEADEVEDVPAVTGFVEMEPADAEAPVEEAVSEDLPVQDAIDEEMAESPEVPAEEAPAEPAPVEVMRLPGMIEGLKAEGNEPSSESESSDMIAESVQMEVAETCVEAAPAPTPKASVFEADGEALPPLSDPVVKRPRTVRFRFSNGVLQNVEPEKVEPREELRDPLA